MRKEKKLRFVSQVHNRASGEETGEEPLHGAAGAPRDLPAYQLNEAGGPLGEEFNQQGD